MNVASKGEMGPGQNLSTVYFNSCPGRAWGSSSGSWLQCKGQHLIQQLQCRLMSICRFHLQGRWQLQHGHSSSGCALKQTLPCMRVPDQCSCAYLQPSECSHWRHQLWKGLSWVNSRLQHMFMSVNFLISCICLINCFCATINFIFYFNYFKKIVLLK